MNKLGNLSNSNLEAIRANACMIIPSPQIETGVDVVTKKLLGDAVITTPKEQYKDLSKEIFKLLQSEEKRKKMSNLINERKQNFLWTWDERINAELALLNKICLNRP